MKTLGHYLIIADEFLNFPYILYLISYILYLISYILYLIPYTLYLIPYTRGLIAMRLYWSKYFLL